ncbi:MAG: hypothetical protein MJ000_10860 [Bacteroidales bacterium]|nr:hypothetical protein [Bacteroidales bacterium]
MTAEIKSAKDWLNRRFNFYQELEADKRTLEKLENLVNSAVGSYTPREGSTDADKARQRHEDLLADYSEQLETIERKEAEYRGVTETTRKAIAELSKSTYRAIAIDRYINCLKWKDIARVEHISEQHLYKLHGEMLREMAEILRRGTYFD